MNDRGRSEVSQRRFTRRPERRYSTPSTAVGAAVRAGKGKELTLGSYLPSLRVSGKGPSAITIGKEATYVVYIENQGSEPAEHVAVTVNVPKWVKLVTAEPDLGAVRRHSAVADPAASPIAPTGLESHASAGNSPETGGVLSWRLAQLPPRARANLVLIVTPQSAQPFNLRLDWSCAPRQAAAHVDVLQPKLEMAITGPQDVLYGETKLYTVTLSNPGTGDAENVHVTLAPLSPGESSGGASPVGVIAAGAHKQIQVELTARQAGEMIIHLDATADGGLAVDAEERVLVRRAKLNVSTEGPPLKFAGTTGRYQILVKNEGDAIAENVRVTVSIPPGAKYLGGVDGANVSPGGVTWQAPNLGPDAQRVFQLECQLLAEGDNTFNVRVQSADQQSKTAQAITKVEALADLKLAVNDPKGPRPVGDTVVYEMVIVNRGTKAARDVHVLAQFSEGIEPKETVGGQAEIVPGQAVFQPIPQIDPGQTVRLKVTATAEKSGNHVFRCEVRCTAPETKLVSENTTRYFGEG